MRRRTTVSVVTVLSATPTPSLGSAGSRPSFKRISKLETTALEERFTTVWPEFSSTPSASLSLGLIKAAVGPEKSARSKAPRSMNTFVPRPFGGSTEGSSTRNCPVTSRIGAMIGEGAIPIGSFTKLNSNRSPSELTELSIARLGFTCEPGSR